MFIVLTYESDSVPDLLSEELRLGTYAITEAKYCDDTRINIVDTDDFVSEEVTVLDLIRYIGLFGVDQFIGIEEGDFDKYYVVGSDCFYDLFEDKATLNLDGDIHFNMANNTLTIKDKSYSFNMVEHAVDESKLNAKLAKDILMGEYVTDKRYFNFDSSAFHVTLEYYIEDICEFLETFLGSIYFKDDHFLCINMVIYEKNYGNFLDSVSFLYDLSLNKFVNITSTCKEFKFKLK